VPSAAIQPTILQPVSSQPVSSQPVSSQPVSSQPVAVLDSAKCCQTSRRLVWPEPSANEVNSELATTMLAKPVLKHPATLLFTSPCDGDGKTDLLLSLAPLLAWESNRRVLVVDADSRKGDLSTRLSAGNPGLSDLLSGNAGIAEATCPTTIPQLSVLPSGTSGYGVQEADANELSTSAIVNLADNPTAWETTLDNLKCRYPIVLLDSPSLAHPGVTALGALCDGIYLVVHLGQTPRRTVHEAAELIGKAGGRLLGCIAIGD
jgi:Mrp family chromosome partitioning ATPase